MNIYEKMKIKLTLLTLLSFIISGCASITTGTTQNILISTSPENATCILSNDKGSWTINNTPGTINVHKSFSDLTIICTRQGYKKTTQQIKSNIQPIAAGNLLAGGIVIGGAIDTATGAAFVYPDKIQIDLTK